jgi:hypothetical protein
MIGVRPDLCCHQRVDCAQVRKILEQDSKAGQPGERTATCLVNPHFNGFPTGHSRDIHRVLNVAHNGLDSDAALFSPSFTPAELCLGKTRFCTVTARPVLSGYSHAAECAAWAGAFRFLCVGPRAFPRQHRCLENRQ